MPKQSFQGTLTGSIGVLLLKYIFVVSVGVAFFMNHSEEAKLQKEQGEEMNFVTALYWTTVIASAVGYGHCYFLGVRVCCISSIFSLVLWSKGTATSLSRNTTTPSCS
jgi:hypothetical protein